MKKLISYLLLITFILFYVPIDAKEIDAKEKEGRGEETGSATKSSGVDAGVSPERPDQLGIESSSCTWWWLYGQHRWSWSGIPGLYVSYSSWGASWTEYGTSTGGCGIPLTVDKLYVRVVEYPREFPYTEYDSTAYNTTFVERTNNGWCIGCTNICGARSYHTATKSGVTWSVSARSGCA